MRQKMVIREVVAPTPSRSVQRTENPFDRDRPSRNDENPRRAASRWPRALRADARGRPAHARAPSARVECVDRVLARPPTRFLGPGLMLPRSVRVEETVLAGHAEVATRDRSTRLGGARDTRVRAACGQSSRTSAGLSRSSEDQQRRREPHVVSASAGADGESGRVRRRSALGSRQYPPSIGRGRSLRSDRRSRGWSSPGPIQPLPSMLPWTIDARTFGA